MSETSTTAVPSAANSPMAEVLERLWTKFFPEIEKRLVVLENFARTTGEARASLPAEFAIAPDRVEAHATAHKLAGILGTFGLTRGTELARQVEHLLVEPDAELGVDDAANLKTWVEELRVTIGDGRL